MSKNNPAINLVLEDLFFTKSEKESPISEQTWQSWHQNWFSLLKPDIPQSNAYEISLRLTDDQEIKILNHQFRNQDKATDVLSFACLEVNQSLPDLLDSLYLGDIIISVETAKRQATQQNHPLKVELAWLASHGFLHLLGWDHPDEFSLTKMLAQQEIMLKKTELKRFL